MTWRWQLGGFNGCRMTESSYDLMFSKLARARLFDMYFAEAHQVLASLVLQPADDPRVDVTACVIKLLYMCSRSEGNFVPVSLTNLMQFWGCFCDGLLHWPHCVIMKESIGVVDFAIASMAQWIRKLTPLARWRWVPTTEAIGSMPLLRYN